MRRLLPILLFAITLSSCNPVKDSDIIFEQEEIISNLDKLEGFIKNVKKGNEDKIRIVRKTVEGAPIFDTLKYNGNSIFYTHDNSHDGFGGADKGKESSTCKNLESEKSEIGMKYYLTECSSEIGEYFYFEIPK